MWTQARNRSVELTQLALYINHYSEKRPGFPGQKRRIQREEILRLMFGHTFSWLKNIFCVFFFSLLKFCHLERRSERPKCKVNEYTKYQSFCIVVWFVSPPPPPQVSVWGEPHPLAGEGVVGPKSYDCTETLVFYGMYCIIIPSSPKELWMDCLSDKSCWVGKPAAWDKMFKIFSKPVTGKNMFVNNNQYLSFVRPNRKKDIKPWTAWIRSALVTVFSYITKPGCRFASLSTSLVSGCAATSP